MIPIKELDAVALARDVPEHALRRGDVGTGVLVHGNGEGFEVELVGDDSHTVALRTLDRAQVRPLRGFLEGQSGGMAPPPAARMDG